MAMITAIIARLYAPPAWPTYDPLNPHYFVVFQGSLSAMGRPDLTRISSRFLWIMPAGGV